MPEHSRLFITVWRHFRQKNAQRMGAAISFYALFSLAPLLIILITVTGVFFQENQVENAVTHYVGMLLSPSSAQYIRSLIDTAQSVSFGIVGAIVGVITLVITGIGVLSELQSDLNELWRAPNEEPSPAKKYVSLWMTVRSTIGEKILILSVLPILACILGVSTIASTITADLSLFFGNDPALIPTILAVDLALSLGIGVLLFALIFRIFPARKLPWNELLLGGLVTSTLFLIGKIGMSLYLDTIADTAKFGQAGSLVVLLIWIYYSAQVFFLGASFTFVHSLEKGTLRHEKTR